LQHNRILKVNNGGRACLVAYKELDIQKSVKIFGKMVSKCYEIITGILNFRRG
jgi:hypothetical protein